MADLFLDTDYLGIVGPERVADRIRPARYDLDTLDRIFSHEVAPAVGFNLFEIAGEWAGWDRSWLQERILLVSRSKRLRYRLLRAWHRNSNQGSWRKVRQALEAPMKFDHRS